MGKTAKPPGGAGATWLEEEEGLLACSLPCVVLSTDKALSFVRKYQDRLSFS